VGIPGRKNEIIVPNGIVIWLDVDGTIMDFYREFAKHARKYGYKIPVNYIPEEYSYGELMPEKKFRKLFMEMGDGWPARLIAFPGAAEFTRRLKEIGCRVIILTKLPGHQGPERFKALLQHHIYFDEAYLTYGRTKSQFAKPLTKRYKNSQGQPTMHILIDDNGDCVTEFVENMPNSRAITMTLKYNRPWHKQMKKSKRVHYRAKDTTELYEMSLKYIGKLLTSRKGK
jgi:hypothetical protein